jgi:hypothetical protein
MHGMCLHRAQQRRTQSTLTSRFWHLCWNPTAQRQERLVTCRIDASIRIDSSRDEQMRMCRSRDLAKSEQRTPAAMNGSVKLAIQMTSVCSWIRLIARRICSDTFQAPVFDLSRGTSGLNQVFLSITIACQKRYLSMCMPDPGCIKELLSVLKKAE